MENGIAEILKSGKPPLFAGTAKDETSSDSAIPRALRQMEETMPARKIAKDSGWSVEHLKKTWLK